MRPAVPDLEVVASSHRYGHSPSSGRSRKAFTRSSMSLHSFETWLFEMLDRPIACTSSSTRRVDTPRIHVTEDGAWPIIFYDRRVTCWQPHVKGWTVMVKSIFNGWRMEDVWLDK